MRFSSVEVQHIGRAWLVVSLAFAVLLSDSPLFSVGFLAVFGMAAFTVGLGFLLHELSHKWLAQRYGCRAEFRAFDGMLLIALVMSFFGFVFAAPGAVFIKGNISKAKNGQVSAAGPVVNICLALVFFIAGSLVPFAGASPLLSDFAAYGSRINSWLAVFNMLPFWQLDGLKVFGWSKRVYAVVMAAAVLSMALPYFMS